jgi:hypothetical protein
VRADSVTSAPDGSPGGDSGSGHDLRDQRFDAGTVGRLDAGPDVGGIEAAKSSPDVVGFDAVKSGLDAIGSDARKAGLDGDASGASDSGSDGRAIEASDAGRVSDTGGEPADSRVADVAVWDPDGGTRRDEIIRACALATSCGSYAKAYSASRCISEFGKTASRPDDIKLDHLLTCAKAVPRFGACSDFPGCWGGTLFTLEPFVAGGQCDKDSIKVTPAGESNPVFLSCGAMNGVCERLATDEISVACNARSCGEADRPTPACDGTTASGCGEWGEYTRLDCAWSGRQCQVQGGRAICAGTEGACSDSDRVTCAGSVATYCSRGALAKVDCAKTGTATRCAAGAPSTEPCTAAGTECDPNRFAASCDGNRLQVCVDGSIVSVACSDIGLVICWQPTVGVAQCKPGV